MEAVTHHPRTEGAESHCSKRPEPKPKGLATIRRKADLGQPDKNG
jgi:hypothetical protein